MTRYLYTVEPVPDRPDIAWVSFPVPLKAMTERTVTLHLMESVGALCLALDGQEVPRPDGPIIILQSVGSYNTEEQKQSFIAHRVELMARTRIAQALDSLHTQRAASKAVSMLPWTNSLWILKATPEELQSWAETLARR